MNNSTDEGSKQNSREYEDSRFEPRNWLIISVLLVIIIVVIALFLFWIQKPFVDDWDHIEFETQKNDAGWKINIKKAHVAYKGDIGFEPAQVMYFINDEHGDASEINSIPSKGYNVTWIDDNNNGLFDKGDYFFIDLNGGNSGKAKSGDIFFISTRNGGGPWEVDLL